VVPHGEVTFALMAFGVALAGAAFYQAIMLSTLRFRWFQRSFPMVSIFVAPAVLFGWFFYAVRRWQHSGTPRQFPTALAPSDWIIAALTAHPLRLVAVALVVIIGALTFGCRRFINQEVVN
jgi:cytochrome bd-type quinol oxidase subunit 1